MLNPYFISDITEMVFSVLCVQKSIWYWTFSTVPMGSLIYDMTLNGSIMCMQFKLMSR